MEGGAAIDLAAVTLGPLPLGRYEVTATTADGRTASASARITQAGEHAVRLIVGD